VCSIQELLECSGAGSCSTSRRETSRCTETKDHFAAAERLIGRHSFQRRLRTLDALQLAVALDLAGQGAARLLHCGRSGTRRRGCSRSSIFFGVTFQQGSAGLSTSRPVFPRHRGTRTKRSPIAVPMSSSGNIVRARLAYQASPCGPNIETTENIPATTLDSSSGDGVQCGSIHPVDAGGVWARWLYFSTCPNKNQPRWRN
jgi:hypothetical protein